jgi:hypothetical protein
MFEWNSELIIAHFAMYKEQLMALGVVPSDLDSTAKSFADLKVELDKEKAAQETAQVEVDNPTRAVKDLKIFTNKFPESPPSKRRLNT